jgi:hypothetical protein
MHVVRRWACGLPSEVEKSSRDGPHQTSNTRQQGEFREAAGSAREKPANALGRGLKLLMHSTGGITPLRACGVKNRTSPAGEILSNAPSQKRWLRHTPAGKNSHSRL